MNQAQIMMAQIAEEEASRRDRLMILTILLFGAAWMYGK
jgi:hypothetical protein